MLSELEQKVLDAYRDGADIGYIVESFNIPYKKVANVLENYKNQNMVKNTYTEEFKILIAERDMNGVGRQKIADELGVNVNTVRNACKKYGQVIKEKTPSENAYTKIEGKSSLEVCPICDNKRVNELDYGAKYCKECGTEFFRGSDSYIYVVNWEYVD